MKTSPLFAFITVLSMGAVAAPAAITTWTSTSGTDFNTASNWNGGVPASSSTAVFVDGASLQNTVSLSTSSTINVLSFTGTSTNYSLSAAAGTSLTIDTNSNANKVGIQVTGSGVTQTLSGTINLSNAAYNQTISLNVAGGSTLTFDSNSTLNVTTANGLGTSGSGNIIINGALISTETGAANIIILNTPISLYYNPTSQTFASSLCLRATGGGTIYLQKAFAGKNIILGYTSANSGNAYLSAANINNASSITMNSTNTGVGAGNFIFGSNAANGSSTKQSGGISLSTTTGNISTDQIDVQNNNIMTVSGVISGVTASGGTTTLKKTGNGTLILTAANTYDAATEVASGTLTVNGNNSGATGLVTVDSGAYLGGSGTIGGVTVNSGTMGGTLTYTKDVTINSGGVTTGGTFNGNITNNGSITSGLAVASAKTLSGSGTLSGAVTNSGTIAGTLTFGNDVTINNGGTVTGGTFNGNISDNGLIAIGLTVASGKTLSGTGSVNGAVTAIGNITGGGLTFTNDVTVSSGASASAKAFNNVTVNSGATASASTFNGNIVDNGNITSAVNVASGKVLSGTGSVTGATTVSGTTSAGNGNNTGVLKLDLTYNSGATANFTVSGSSATSSPTALNTGLSYSQIEVTTNNLQLGSTGQTLTNGVSNSGVTLELSMSAADFATVVAHATNSYYGYGSNSTLANYFVFAIDDGLTTTGKFQTLTLDIDGVDYTATIYYSGASDRFDGVSYLGDVTINVSGTTQEFAISYAGNYASNSITGGNDIVLTAVPEPGVWGMVVAGLGMLAFGQQFRRKF